MLVLTVSLFEDIEGQLVGKYKISWPRLLSLVNFAQVMDKPCLKPEASVLTGPVT